MRRTVAWDRAPGCPPVQRRSGDDDLVHSDDVDDRLRQNLGDIAVSLHREMDVVVVVVGFVGGRGAHVDVVELVDQLLLRRAHGAHLGCRREMKKGGARSIFRGDDGGWRWKDHRGVGGDVFKFYAYHALGIESPTRRISPA